MRCGRLKGEDGELVENDNSADAIADHMEKVQWYVRPLGDVEGPRLGPDLPVVLDNFTEHEVALPIRRLKKRKTAGPDEIPAEFWQAVAEDAEGLAWMAMLCNKCWSDEVVPQEWRTANVSCIHKKVPVDDRDNYRPISSVCVAYKLFASLLHQRL